MSEPFSVERLREMMDGAPPEMREHSTVLWAADEIERLRAERDDHKARLCVEAFTAPDADFDTMIDSLQSRIGDMADEIVPSDRTIKSIELQGSKDVLNRYDIYGCGCERKHQTGRWILCQYHEGFDEGVERADELQEKIDAFAGATLGTGKWLVCVDRMGEITRCEPHTCFAEAVTRLEEAMRKDEPVKPCWYCNGDGSSCEACDERQALLADLCDANDEIERLSARLRDAERAIRALTPGA